MIGNQVDNAMHLDHTAVNEIPLVIGVLMWILTALHNRRTKQYPTRSLKLWKIASIMQSHQR